MWHSILSIWQKCLKLSFTRNLAVKGRKNRASREPQENVEWKVSNLVVLNQIAYLVVSCINFLFMNVPAQNDQKHAKFKILNKLQPEEVKSWVFRNCVAQHLIRIQKTRQKDEKCCLELQKVVSKTCKRFAEVKLNIELVETWTSQNFNNFSFHLTC